MRPAQFGTAGCVAIALLVVPGVVMATPTTAAAEPNAKIRTAHGSNYSGKDLGSRRGGTQESLIAYANLVGTSNNVSSRAKGEMNHERQ